MPLDFETAFISAEMAINYVAYAEIYTSANSTMQSIPTGGTYTQITGFTANGNSENCTPDYANNKITVTKAGKYKVVGTFSSKLGTTDVLWDTAIFVGGVEAPSVHMRHRFSTSGYTFSVAIDGIIDVPANTDIDVRSKHNNAGTVNITVEYANLNVIRIGS